MKILVRFASNFYEHSMSLTREQAEALLSQRARHGLSLPSSSPESGEPSIPAVRPPELHSATSWDAFGKSIGLHCCSNPGGGGALSSSKMTRDFPWRTSQRSSLAIRGYAKLEGWAADAGRLDALTKSFGAAIDHLDAAGLSAVFLLAFDEVWEVVDSLRAVLQPLFGHGLTFDFYVFNVKPGGTGWAMHRERAGADARVAFGSSGDAADDGRGMPMYNTVWLALTDASPMSSCMYALPAHADEFYSSEGASSSGDDGGVSRPDDNEPIEAIVARGHTHVTALPVTSGTALVWSHRLIHWGSAHGGSQDARKTLAFALADPRFEPPLLRSPPPPPSLPPLSARLAIIAHLLVRYHHEASHPARLWPRTLLSALTLLRDTADALSDAALEWVSSDAQRTSPVAQGSVLQCNLVSVHAEHCRALEEAPDELPEGSDAHTAMLANDLVEEIARYITQTRHLSASDELRRLAQYDHVQESCEP